MLGKLKNTKPSTPGGGAGGRQGRSASPSARLASGGGGGGGGGNSGRSASPSSRTKRSSSRSTSPSSRLRGIGGGGGGGGDASGRGGRGGRSSSPSAGRMPLPGIRSSRSASPSSRFQQQQQRGRSASPSSRLNNSHHRPSLRERSNSFSKRLGSMPLMRPRRSGSPSSGLRGGGGLPPPPPGGMGFRRTRSLSPSARLRARSRSRSASPSRRLTMSGEIDRRQSYIDAMNGGEGGKEGPGGGPGRRRRGMRESMRMIISSPRDGNCTFRKICGYLAPIALLLLSSAGLVIATGNAARFTPDFLEELIPKFSNNDLVDPYSGGDGETTYAKWDNAGQSGLKLEVLNAMSDSWDVWFSLVIADWEYGNPDSLTLPYTKIAEDKACKEVKGKLKICNGNYGETKWRGINAATQDDKGFIIASAARMNEFYLNFDGEGAKQYTLCHEIGHGFGLTHTDEVFGNPDLGNCLDYTDNFGVNKHPDVSNYESLLGLYGPASGRRGLLRSSESSSSSSSEASKNYTRNERKLSPSFWNRLHDSVEKLAARIDDNAHEDGWRLLHRSKHGEEHELELEEGYHVRVHMLLVQ